MIPTKFIFYHNGDSSVGIQGESVSVEYDGEFHDVEYKNDFVDAIRDALAGVMDGKIHVTEEHEHTCKNCQAVVRHLDDHCDIPFFCSILECRLAAVAEEEAMWKEQEAAQEAAWNRKTEEEKDALMYGDFNKDYFREHNEKTLAGINGAGVKC